MGDVHPNAVKVELLEELAKIAPKPLSITILSSTGAEAVESALKTAKLFTGKPGVISFEGAYHGLTYGTLSATDRSDFTAPFKDQIPQFGMRLPFPDPLHGITDEDVLHTLEQKLRKGAKKVVGAILYEPIQGRGGIRAASPAFLKGLRAIARRYKLLLIADEVMTGFGRTGNRFAAQDSGVIPDLLCIGKALGNGFPISACLGSPKIMRAWPVSDGEAIHTSTFLGNPLGCAMALAAIQEAEKLGLAARARGLGRDWIPQLQRTMEPHPQVAEVRGRGLMVGIEFVKDKRTMRPDAKLASQVVVRALQKGLLLLSGGLHRNVLTLLPPLTISKQDLSRSTQILKDILYGKD